MSPKSRSPSLNWRQVGFWNKLIVAKWDQSRLFRSAAESEVAQALQNFPRCSPRPASASLPPAMSGGVVNKTGGVVTEDGRTLYGLGAFSFWYWCRCRCRYLRRILPSHAAESFPLSLYITNNILSNIIDWFASVSAGKDFSRLTLLSSSRSFLLCHTSALLAFGSFGLGLPNELLPFMILSLMSFVVEIGLALGNCPSASSSS